LQGEGNKAGNGEKKPSPTGDDGSKKQSHKGTEDVKKRRSPEPVNKGKEDPSSGDDDDIFDISGYEDPLDLSFDLGLD
jgi:hypothetical protein